MLRPRFLLAALMAALCAGAAWADAVSDAQTEARGYRGVPADRIMERGPFGPMPGPPQGVDFFERPMLLGAGLCRSVVYRVGWDRDGLSPRAIQQKDVIRLGRYRMVDSDAECAAFTSVRSFFEATDPPTALRATNLLRRAMVQARGQGALSFKLRCSEYRPSRPICATARRRLATLPTGDLTSVSTAECLGGAPGQICYQLNTLYGVEPLVTIVSSAGGDLLALKLAYDLPRVVV